jgi:DNA-binding transcriptional MocR family regulator
LWGVALVGDDQYRDESDLKKYRTEIPNMIFDIGLTPYEVALYGHLKRVCGAEAGGKCWKSVSTLSKETGMSSGRVSEARAELARRGLIHTRQPKGPGTSVTVTIADIWPQNIMRYSAAGNPSHYEGGLHSMKGNPSRGETKKEPLEEKPIKNHSKTPKSKEKPRSTSARARQRESERRVEQIRTVFGPDAV